MTKSQQDTKPGPPVGKPSGLSAQARLSGLMHQARAFIIIPVAGCPCDKDRVQFLLGSTMYNEGVVTRRSGYLGVNMGTSSVETPEWALERIREAREKKSDSLDLAFPSWLPYRDESGKLTEFPEEILELRWLRVLTLRGNRLKMLPESISQLQNLTELWSYENQLSTLPESIGQLQNLTELYLDRNQLSMLPESIGHLQNLTTLDLSHNQLSMLPQSIGQLQNLTSLELRGNGLSTLPKSITQLQNLTTLDLRGNPLVSHPSK